MKRWQLTFDRLDALSRTRALSDQESELLETAIFELDRPERGAPPTRNFAWSMDEEHRFSAHIAAGDTIRDAARKVGRSPNGANRKWAAIQEKGV